MRIERLDISYLRNLKAVSVEPGPQVNLFWGRNGAGKTAILEAVHLLARGRSFRAGRGSSLIQHGAEALAVRAVLVDEHRGRQSVAISRDLRSQTQLRLNGEKERRLSAVAQLIPVQLMLPDIGQLVFGAPAERRRLLDWGMFHVKQNYLDLLQEYLRVLKQRNAALKTAGRGIRSEDLAVWTDQLQHCAERLTAARKDYLAELAPVLLETLRELAPELNISLELQQGWPEGEPLSKVLGEQRAREVKLGATQSGPHRADLRLSTGGLDAHAVLSRGQGKILATALKVSQAKLLAFSAKRRSLFLIDDVGAELDETHSARFFTLLGNMDCQILATSTERGGVGLGEGGLAITRFHVEQGQIRPSGI